MGACCFLLHHQIYALEDICHPPYTLAIKFMSVLFVSRWCFPFNISQIYLVYLSFQNVFLSKTLKITLYFN